MYIGIRQWVLNYYWKYIEDCKQDRHARHEPTLMDFLIWLEMKGYLDEDAIKDAYAGGVN